MQIDPVTSEAVLRICYCGPGYAGKSSNFAWLRRTYGDQAEDVVAIDVHSERTLMLALRPAGAKVYGRTVRVELWTVPGQSYYAATRKQILAGADATVFVADCRREALDENIASLNEMFLHLRELAMGQEVPIALQYNKQDLPGALTPAQLQPMMNPRSWTWIAAVATAGTGVQETLNAVLGLAIEAAATGPAPEELAPAAALAPTRTSWLISCYRCQNLLEVPNAAPGTMYTCGICASVMEVVDTEHGLTKAYEPPARAATTPKPVTSQWQKHRTPLEVVAEPDEYGMKTMPGATAALSTAGQQVKSGPQRLAIDAGFQLAGFEALATLDVSAIGRRFQVREIATGRTMRALVIAPNYYAQPGIADQLDSYVRLAGPISHPGILPLLQSAPDGNTMVFVSNDAVGYEPLSQVLARRRALAPPHAMGILHQVAVGLEEAARAGVVHGWLRPEVILVSPDGNVLIDELAVLKSSRFLLRELSGDSAATEYYLAPEHLNEETRNDLRTDQFLLGALLFRMLTGEGLVTGYNPLEALHKITTNGAKPLRNATNTFSRDLETFYRRLTATDRRERFETWRQCIEVFDRFGGGAKRQTLRLTQSLNQAPAGSSAAGGVRRPGQPAGHSATPRHGTRVPSGSNLPRAQGGPMPSRPPLGPGGPPRLQPTTGHHRELAPRQPEGSGATAVIVVLLLVLGAGGIAAAIMLTGKPPPQPQPRVVERPQPPAPAPAIAAKPVPQPVAVVPAQRAPEPAQATVSPVLTPLARIDLLKEISNLLLNERFGDAVALSEKLPDERDRINQRLSIVRLHGDRQAFWERRFANAADPTLLKDELTTAIGNWGFEDDKAWAEALMTRQPRPIPQVAVVTPGQAKTPEPTTAPAQATEDPAFRIVEDVPTTAAHSVFRALALNQNAAALSGLSQLPLGTPDQAALSRIIESHRARIALIKRVAEAKQPRLHAVHPVTRELCDVTDADDLGATLTAPTGARALVPWPQLTAKETGRLANECQAAKDLTPNDVATAVATLLIGGDPVSAALAVRRPRLPLGELQAELETWLVLARRVECQEVLNHGVAAAKSGNVKALTEAIATLRLPEHAATPAAAQVPTLEGWLARLEAGTTQKSGPRDRALFDEASDLDSFPLSSPGWSVANGSASHTAPTARLGRGDAANARSLQIVYTPQVRRGGMTVQFRGLNLTLDLTSGEFTVAPIGGRRTGPKPFPIATGLPNTLFLTYDPSDNQMEVQFNNGAASSKVVMGDMDGACAITLSDTTLALEEVAIVRDEAANPDRAALRALGLEAIGQPRVANKALQLADGAGVSMPINSSSIGIDLTVSGNGVLHLVAANPSRSATVACDVTLDAAPARLTLRWNGGRFTLSDDKGAELYRAAMPPGADRLSITAPGQATVALPIQSVRP